MVEKGRKGKPIKAIRKVGYMDEGIESRWESVVGAIRHEQQRADPTVEHR